MASTLSNFYRSSQHSISETTRKTLDLPRLGYWSQAPDQLHPIRRKWHNGVLNAEAYSSFKTVYASDWKDLVYMYMYRVYELVCELVLGYRSLQSLDHLGQLLRNGLACKAFVFVNTTFLVYFYFKKIMFLHIYELGILTSSCTVFYFSIIVTL